MKLVLRQKVSFERSTESHATPMMVLLIVLTEVCVQICGVLCLKLVFEFRNIQRNIQPVPVAARSKA